jgi:predicted dehydrogenase
MLDRPDLDILVVAAPNHWHAPATIAACSAKKHVYVEKPCSHTAQEGEWAVEAARKNNCVVTMGVQRRSRAPILEAMQKLHAGAIGNVRFARCWYANRRPSIGIGKQTEVPGWLNFDLWQGPAPRRPYQDNVLHYNWHWFWHWGNGELGNNGVHALDLARWGLQVDFPHSVTSTGGRYFYDDDQETPDTHVICFDFGDRAITWEGLSCNPLGPDGTAFGVSFHGDKGTMKLFDSGYQILDMSRKLTEEASGPGADEEHFADFLKCIREGGSPTADIAEAHKSTLLCHLGNIAQRTGRALRTDPANGRILADPAATQLWGREYEPGWTPRV